MIVRILSSLAQLPFARLSAGTASNTREISIHWPRHCSCQSFAVVLSLVLVTLPLTSSAVESGDSTMRFYGRTAEVSGDIRSEEGPGWLLATGESSASWEPTITRSGDYLVSIAYAAEKSGGHYSLSIGGVKQEGTLSAQPGVFVEQQIDFGRLSTGVAIHLESGVQRMRLSLQTASKVYLRSLELTPVGDVGPAEREVIHQRANTDWLAHAGYGVMFHWTSQSQPRHGKALSYSDAVRAFDVPQFVSLVKSTGAGYVIFTVNHANPHCPAPIQSWERVHPGSTTTRDLLGELAGSLSKEHIPLILYMASHVLGDLGRVSGAEYLQIHKDILAEFGRRYGSLVSGYWFDGWYQTMQTYPEISAHDLLPYVRAGNVQRLVAYNFWVYPVETLWQDYWAGEVGGIVKPTPARFPTFGPAAGLQSHNLLFLDAPWVHSTPESEMEPPRFSDEDLIGFVRTSIAHQGAVTLNLGVYQDGTIGEKTMQQMVSLRRVIRGR